jgi:hypothetical protein
MEFVALLRVLVYCCVCHSFCSRLFADVLSVAAHANPHQRDSQSHIEGTGYSSSTGSSGTEQVSEYIDVGQIYTHLK